MRISRRVSVHNVGLLQSALRSEAVSWELTQNQCWSGFGNGLIGVDASDALFVQDSAEAMLHKEAGRFRGPQREGGKVQCNKDEDGVDNEGRGRREGEGICVW